MSHNGKVHRVVHSISNLLTFVANFGSLVSNVVRPFVQRMPSYHNGRVSIHLLEWILETLQQTLVIIGDIDKVLTVGSVGIRERVCQIQLIGNMKVVWIERTATIPILYLVTISTGEEGN